METTIKLPVQKRSQNSFKRVISAGTELLKNCDHQGFSILELSGASGVSVGTIYQRFESKEKLYLVLQDSILTELDRQATAQFPAEIEYADEATAIKDTIRRFAEHVSNNENVLRAMIQYGAMNADVDKRGHRSSQHIGKAFKSHLARHIFSIKPEDRRTSFEMCFTTAFSCLWRWLADQSLPESEVPLPFDVMVEELSRMCERYLLG